MTEDEIIDSSVRFQRWVQTYSKTIVSITFIIYVAINIFILSMTVLQYYKYGELNDLSTLISETNITFRDVIGGYIIKSAAENSFKIIGAFTTKYLKIKNDITDPEPIVDHLDPDFD